MDCGLLALEEYIELNNLSTTCLVFALEKFYPKIFRKDCVLILMDVYLPKTSSSFIAAC